MIYLIKDKKLTDEKIFSLSEELLHKSIYHLTYNDITSYYKVSYSLATKVMTHLVKSGIRGINRVLGIGS